MENTSSKIPKIFWGLGIVLILVIVVFAWYFYISPKTSEKLEALPDNETSVLSSVFYQFEQTPEQARAYSSDFQIIESDLKSGKKTVLVPSVKEAVPELNSQGNHTLSFLSTSTDASKLYFEEIYDGTDAGILGFYVFHIKERAFERLLVNTGSMILSPDGQRMAYASRVGQSFDDYIETIFIYDLNLEKIVASSTLDKSEQVSQWMGFSGIFAKWIDNYHLQYDVYKKSDIENSDPAKNGSDVSAYDHRVLIVNSPNDI